MASRLDTSDPDRRPRRGTRTTLAVGAVAALIVAPAAVAVAHAGAIAKSAQSVAISAVLNSGVMGKSGHGFKPNQAATRGQLALALQRSMPRLALTSIGSSAPASGSVELGAVRLKIDGVPGKNQAVLLTFNGQLDHDNALSAGCFPSFSVTRNASSTVVASRTQEEYGGGGGTGLELPVSMQFLVFEKTGTSTNYHLTLTNPCTATLFIDGGDFTAQNVTLGGNGKALTPAKLAKQQVQRVAPHDR